MPQPSLPAPNSPDHGPLSLPLMNELSAGGKPFPFGERHLEKHLAVLGGTGSGKSKFLELLMRQLLLAYRGFCLIDPHGDLSEDLLAFAERRRVDLGTDAILKRIHYLEPGYDVLFGYDPFQFNPSRPIPEHLRQNAYLAWLHTKVDRVSEIIQRKQGQTDFEGMPRLQRVLRDVLYAVGMKTDEAGKHLPFSDALVILEPDHPRHRAVYSHVARHLPAEVRADLDRLLGYRRPEERLKETESTLNRLRSFFSPILQAIFSRTEHTIDFRSIIQRGHILLVNLRETDYFSADQANALGGLFIHQVLSAAATTDRDRRTPFYLFIDEAARFVGDDVQRALGECRKHKLSVVLAAQDLSSFKRKDFDMSQKVLSQCRSQVCFQQQHPDDLDVLAQVLGYGNIDFTELMQVMDRPDGHEMLEVEEYTEGTNRQRTSGRNESESVTDTRSRNATEARTSQSSWQRGESHQSATSHAESSGTNRSETHGTSESETTGPPESAGRGQPSSETRGRQDSTTEGTSRTLTEGRTESHGTSRSVGGAEGKSRGTSQGTSRGVGKTRGTSIGEAEGESRGVSHKKVFLSKTREEFQATGRLERSVDDQFHMLKAMLHRLPTRCAIVKLVDEPRAVPIEVARVDEPFASPSSKAHAIELIKSKLYETHPYYFRPAFGIEEQDSRIDRFLAGGPRVEDARRDVENFG